MQHRPAREEAQGHWGTQLAFTPSCRAACFYPQLRGSLLLPPAGCPPYWKLKRASVYSGAARLGLVDAARVARLAPGWSALQRKSETCRLASPGPTDVVLTQKRETCRLATPGPVDAVSATYKSSYVPPRDNLI